MRKLIAVENVTLDGVMQAPGRADEDTRGGFTHGGWAIEPMSNDPDAAQASMADQSSVDTMLFGHRTYDDLVGHWLAETEPNPFTEILASTPKYVASRSANATLPHPNSYPLDGDVIEAVRALKARDGGDIVILGSGMLVRDLAAAGLIDEFILTTVPVVLGSGTRLFGDGHMPLEVVKSVTSPTGIVVATYRVVRD